MGGCVHVLRKLSKLEWTWSVFSGDTKRGAMTGHADQLSMGSRVRVEGRAKCAWSIMEWKGIGSW